MSDAAVPPQLLTMTSRIAGLPRLTLPKSKVSHGAVPSHSILMQGSPGGGGGGPTHTGSRSTEGRTPQVRELEVGYFSEGAGTLLSLSLSLGYIGGGVVEVAPTGIVQTCVLILPGPIESIENLLTVSVTAGGSQLCWLHFGTKLHQAVVGQGCMNLTGQQQAVFVFFLTDTEFLGIAAVGWQQRTTECAARIDLKIAKQAGRIPAHGIGRQR